MLNFESGDFVRSLAEAAKEGLRFEPKSAPPWNREIFGYLAVGDAYLTGIDDFRQYTHFLAAKQGPNHGSEAQNISKTRFLRFHLRFQPWPKGEES